MVSSNSEYYFADNSDMESKKLDAAKEHYSTGNYEGALKLYLSMLNSSISYKLYHRIAKCYYKMNDLDSALEFFEKSVGLEKINNPSYTYLGNIYYRRKEISSAIYNWVCAFASHPEDEIICLNLATSYFSKNMRFQSVFYYEKYLKYAKNRTESYYAIKKSIEDYKNIGLDFLEKAKYAISRKDNKSAINFLNFAVENFPTSFDINYLLGSIYLEENDNMHAMIYLKQAYSIDSRSLDVIQKLASVFINLGDYTSAYCTMRRLLPLVINNQSEYLNTMQVIKSLDTSFDELSYLGHKTYGDEYFTENNYHFALLEYENCMILQEDIKEELSDKVEQIKSFLNPEKAAIQSNLSAGNRAYLSGDYRTSNKYFSKVMQLSEDSSSEYKLAKSRISNV